MIGKLLEGAFSKKKKKKSPNKERNSLGNFSDLEDNDNFGNDNDLDDDENSNSLINPEQKKKTKNTLFDLLEARVLDVSSYTRSKVFQVWSSLVEERKVPALRISRNLIPLARDRLQDKSSLVRKQAIQLLTIMVVQNPWGPTVELSTDQSQKTLTKLRQEVQVEYINT